MATRSVKLSIAVMAHESRAEFFPYLKEKLGDVPFFVDTKELKLGTWGNARRAWLAYDPSADYHVVIQDDAIICEGFKEKAERFIREYQWKGVHAFNFFYGNRIGKNSERWEGINTGRIIKLRNAWGVAVCMETALIPEMVAECDKMEKIPQDDVRISRFLFSRRRKVVYPIPSLIDHRAGDSLVGDTDKNRIAFWYIENEKPIIRK